MRGRSYIIWALIAMLAAPPSFGNVRQLTHQGMRDVVKIARAIAIVHPKLAEHKYLEYAVGILRASRKYSIEPSILVAITRQETGFRENLPEGAAGERGICQILKNWLKNPKFRSEFRNFSLNDFNNPAKSFMVAAWILKDLKNRSTSGSLPYWSYYNSTQFHNRFKYFLAVNRYIAIMKKYEHQLTDRAISALDGDSDEKDIAFADPVVVPAEVIAQVSAPSAPAPAPAAPKRVTAMAPTTASIAAPVAQRLSKVAEEVRAVVARQLTAPVASEQSAPAVVTTVSYVPAERPVASAQTRLTQAAVAQPPSAAVPVPSANGKTYWLPDALRKVQRQQPRFVSNDGARIISPAIMRAAAELDVEGVQFDGPIQD